MAASPVAPTARTISGSRLPANALARFGGSEFKRRGAPQAPDGCLEPRGRDPSGFDQTAIHPDSGRGRVPFSSGSDFDLSSGGGPRADETSQVRWARSRRIASKSDVVAFVRAVNAPQNFLKHADRGPDGTLELRPLFTFHLLFEACQKFSALIGDPPALFIAFSSWWVLDTPSLLAQTRLENGEHIARVVTAQFSKDDFLRTVTPWIQQAKDLNRLRGD